MQYRKKLFTRTKFRPLSSKYFWVIIFRNLLNSPNMRFLLKWKSYYSTLYTVILLDLLWHNAITNELNFNVYWIIWLEMKYLTQNLANTECPNKIYYKMTFFFFGETIIKWLDTKCNYYHVNNIINNFPTFLLHVFKRWYFSL